MPDPQNDTISPSSSTTYTAFTSAHNLPSMTSSANNAFSLISKSWKDVRDSAESDLKLIKNRADSFKNLATSFDKEIENFINSAVPTIRYSSSEPAEIEFVKKLKPKLSEIRRVYSSPDFSKKVLEKWRSPNARIKIDLSAIRNAIVAEAGEGGYGGWRGGGGTRLRFNEFLGEWRKDGESEDKDWEPIRALKVRLREFERKGSPSEVLNVIKNSEFVEKMKASLVRGSVYLCSTVVELSSYIIFLA